MTPKQEKHARKIFEPLADDHFGFYHGTSNEQWNNNGSYYYDRGHIDIDECWYFFRKGLAAALDSEPGARD